MTPDASLALNRFGIGARPGEAARIAADPRGFLLAQLRQPAAALITDPSLPGAAEAARSLVLARRARREADEQDSATAPPAPAPGGPAESPPDPTALRRTLYQAEIAARLAQGAATEAGFVERLVLFWSNHFAVSVDKGSVHVMGGAFEREAIRPHVLGRFADLHRAVIRHPAMLVYLDNQRSVGPDSAAGLRGGRGLNENLARETLELHTLGVEGGYDQADVVALARALSGWGWVPPRADDPEAGRFRFSPGRHEPGSVTVLGRTYTADGIAQGEAILDDLARHPATARHIARKLAAHVVADAPPEALVARLETVFRESEGDLAAVCAALVAAPEAWEATPRKLKSPYEFVLSALRLLPSLSRSEPPLPRVLVALGQRTFAPPSPRGWPDTAAEWLSPHGFRERIDWAALAGAGLPPGVNPVDLADDSLGPLLSPPARQAIARAESGAQGLALLLMSPEFQRR